MNSVKRIARGHEKPRGLGKGKAHNTGEGAGDPRDKRACRALDGIAAGFALPVSAGDIGIDLGVGQKLYRHGRLHILDPDLAPALHGNGGDDLVAAAGENVQEFGRLAFVPRLAKDAAAAKERGDSADAEQSADADEVTESEAPVEIALAEIDSDEPVELQIATNQVKFTFSHIELISKLVEGKFPDYTRVVPKGYKNNFTISRDLLLRSLQRAAIMTSDKFKGVRCIIAPGSLKISSTNADQEEAVEELEIDYAGDAIEIGFNVTYLMDVLTNMSQDMVRFSLSDGNSSALITLPDSEDFKYVVMPMRI